MSSSKTSSCKNAFERQCSSIIDDKLVVDPNCALLPTPEDLASSVVWAHTTIMKNACVQANKKLQSIDEQGVNPQTNKYNCVNQKGEKTDCLAWVEDDSAVLPWQNFTALDFNDSTYWSPVYKQKTESGQICNPTPGPGNNPCGTKQKDGKLNGPPGSICLQNNDGINICGMSSVPISVCSIHTGVECNQDSDCRQSPAPQKCLPPSDPKNPFNNLTISGSCIIATKNMCNAISQLPYECPPATGEVTINGTNLNAPVACSNGEDISVRNFCKSREGICTGAVAYDESSCNASPGGKWVKKYCRNDGDCNPGVGGIGGVCAPSGNCKFDATKEGKGCDKVQFSDGENPMCSATYVSKKGERGGEGAVGQYVDCCNCDVTNNVCKAPYLEWRSGKPVTLNSGNPPENWEKLYSEKGWDNGSCNIGNAHLRQWAENPCFRSQSAYIATGGKAAEGKGDWPMPQFPFAYDENTGRAYMTKGYAQYYDPEGLTYGGAACTPNDTSCAVADFSKCTGRECLVGDNCCAGEGRSCGQVNKGMQNWFSNDNPYACSEEDGVFAWNKGVRLTKKQNAAPGGVLSCDNQFAKDDFPKCDDTDDTYIYPFGKNNYCYNDSDCTGLGSSSDVTGRCVEDLYGTKSCSGSHSGYGKNAGEQIGQMIIGNSITDWFRGWGHAATTCNRQSEAAKPKEVPPGPNAGYPNKAPPVSPPSPPPSPPQSRVNRKKTSENFEFREKVKDFMKQNQKRAFEQTPDKVIAKCDERDMADSFLVSPNFAGKGVNLYIIVWKDGSRNLGYKFKELKQQYLPFLKKKNNRAHIKIMKDDIRNNKNLKRIYMTISSENWILQLVGKMLTAKFGKNILE